MAGLINDAGANELYMKGVVNSDWADNVDVNEIKIPKIFTTRGNATNTPNDSNWWILEVTQGLRYNTTVVVQKAVQFDNPSNYYVRTCAGNTWTDWALCGNFGYNTLEGLATALKPLLGLS